MRGGVFSAAHVELRSSGWVAGDGGVGGGCVYHAPVLYMSASLRKLIRNDEAVGNFRVARTVSCFSSQTLICPWLPKTSHVSPFRTEGKETATIVLLVMEEPACRDSFLCGSGGGLCFCPSPPRSAAEGPRGPPLSAHELLMQRASQLCFGCVSVSPSAVMIQGLL